MLNNVGKRSNLNFAIDDSKIPTKIDKTIILIVKAKKLMNKSKGFKLIANPNGKIIFIINAIIIVCLTP